MFINSIKSFLFALVYIIIIKLNTINSFISFIYPNSLLFSDGNIFIIHKFGISICNPNLTYIIKNITNFEEDDIISLENFAKITSVYENGYIFNIINDNIYIFDEIGNLLFTNKTKIISSEENPS